jgi:hypothetical protein
MIFTIGHTTSYEQYFREQGTPKKKGRDKNYAGGSVWQTHEEALAQCPTNYSVYGVKASWENDTAQSANGDCHDLLVDSELVKLGLKIK